MPKVVDRAQRRRDISAAVRELIDRDGLEAVTMSRVADRARISVGQVQHYFHAKEELLRHAFQSTMERTWERVEKLTAANEANKRPIRDGVVEGLETLLPLDAERTTDLKVRLAFLGAAANRPAILEEYQESQLHAIGRVARAVTNGKECGEVPDGTDEHGEAVRLTALANGLAFQILEPAAVTREEALDLLRRDVRRTFPHECRNWS
ncbi:TetR/AcrR family transcriptional regulator [Salininema proteolyticum]|uniref:TetR/AcrR family transcriptional regulator n=1 Tax=Salininema proteolyticum TaxID=1607685 RepID=A0ABV8U3V0_9ACTN